MKVLLIEDDIQLNETIKSFLEFKKHTVVSVFDGQEAVSKIDSSNYGLYIIDINIPHYNGLDLIKYIRNVDLITPIIIITASLEIDNLKDAFKYGCSDYIKKPFHLEELNIRVQNSLNSNKNDIIEISKGLKFDFEYEELSIDEVVVKIRKKERRLLTILLKNINHTVSNEILENYIWENEIKERYPLRQLVSDLKKSFGRFSGLIESERGVGYRIVEDKGEI
jgi:DNA-binding response OmpR family regulator